MYLTRAEAGAWGVSPARIDDLLRRGRWNSPARGLYATAAGYDLVGLCRAALPLLPVGSAYGHLTAAQVLGLPLLRVPNRLEVVAPGVAGDTRRGIRIHHLGWRPIVMCCGLPVVDPAWALGDIACRDGLLASLIPADAALRDGLTGRPELIAAVADMGRRHGILTARRLTDLTDGRSESPQETRVRLLLANAGLPAPEPQLIVRLPDGTTYRADLGWREQRVLVEYDGRAAHELWSIRDLRRATALQPAGWCVLRYTSADLVQPARIVSEVATALGRATRLRAPRAG